MRTSSHSESESETAGPWPTLDELTGVGAGRAVRRWAQLRRGRREGRPVRPVREKPVRSDPETIAPVRPGHVPPWWRHSVRRPRTGTTATPDRPCRVIGCCRYCRGVTRTRSPPAPSRRSPGTAGGRWRGSPRPATCPFPVCASWTEWRGQAGSPPVRSGLRGRFPRRPRTSPPHHQRVPLRAGGSSHDCPWRATGPCHEEITMAVVLPRSALSSGSSW
jgi:hypothetical protein